MFHLKALALTLTLILSVNLNLNFARGCSAAEEAALLAFKSAMVDAAAANSANAVLTTWDSSTTTDCCTWSGVACTGSDVTSLNLSSAGLTGALSDDILTSLGGLTALQNLSLASNALSGSVSSNTTWASSLAPTLTSFSLAKNYNITGSIPDSVATLTMLTSLDLSYNQFYGLVPVSLLQLRNLTSFDVSYNGLSGQIPQQAPLTSFPASSYAGNNGLCGSPLDACQSY